MRVNTVLLAIILLIPLTAHADKPDPINNPPLQVKEQNLDGNGWIAVHEQGVVKVEEQGVVDVEVINTPDVNVIGTPEVSIAALESVDMAGYQDNSANYGGSCIVPLYEVPAGMRLVVEQVSGLARVMPGPVDHISAYVSNGATVENTILTQTIAGTYYLEPKRIAGATEDQVLVSQQVRVYVQPEQVLKLIWSIPNYVPGATCWAHVSGYLESVD